MKRPFFIGIAGASGSGKSERARALALRLPGCSLLSLDSYYRTLDHLPIEERHRCNFDHPDALDWELFIRHLDSLSQGGAIDEPVYLFHEHTRAARSRPVESSEFVVVEGIHTLVRRQVRDRLNLKVFVDTPDEECFRRRLERDTRERGRTPESVREQYDGAVRPMAADFVWPSKQHADLVLSGVDSIEAGVALIVAALANRV